MIKSIFRFFENLTNKQAIIIIFILTVFLSLNTFVIVKHNAFYSYVDNSVDSAIDLVQYYVYTKSINREISFQKLDLKSFFTLKSLLCNVNILSIHVTDIILKDDTFVSQWKPPFFFIFSSFILFLAQDVFTFSILLNFILIFFNLLFVYVIVKNLKSIHAGLLSSFILSFTPLFFCLHRTFFLETLYITTILLIFLLVLKYNFNNIFSCSLFVLVLTMAILTKQQIFIYLPVFFLFVVYKQKCIDMKEISIFFVLIIISVLISYFLWYYHNFFNIFAKLNEYAKENWNYEKFYYIKSLFHFDISYIIFSFFLISIIFCFVKKNRKTYPFIISFIYVFFLFFFFSKNSMSRHLFPIIPFVAIVISLFIFDIKNLLIRKYVILFLVLMLFFQYFFINYSDFFMKGNFYKYNFFKGITYYKYIPIMNTYRQEYEKTRQILGNNFENNTIFVEYPPIVYNYFLIQKKDNNNLCKFISYNEFFQYDLANIKNVLFVKPKDLDLFLKIKSSLFENKYNLIKIENKYDYRTLDFKNDIFYYKKVDIF